MKKVWGFIAFSNIVWAIIVAAGVKLTVSAFVIATALNLILMTLEKE